MADALLTLQVLEYDPAPLLAKLAARGILRPFMRRQNISVDDVLPAQPAGYCLCGCGERLAPPRRKWARDDCPWFGYAVQGILLGDPVTIKRYLLEQRRQQGLPLGQCWTCGATSGGLEVDHILAVKLGGGGRWLDNYQLLCPACHQAKTREDRRLIAARHTLSS
jgi:5-methylcytosine-specific restriction endonuclease McrA